MPYYIKCLLTYMVSFGHEKFKRIIGCYWGPVVKSYDKSSMNKINKNNLSHLKYIRSKKLTRS